MGSASFRQMFRRTTCGESALRCVLLTEAAREPDAREAAANMPSFMMWDVGCANMSVGW